MVTESIEFVVQRILVPILVFIGIVGNWMSIHIFTQYVPIQGVFLMMVTNVKDDKGHFCFYPNYSFKELFTFYSTFDTLSNIIKKKEK